MDTKKWGPCAWEFLFVTSRNYPDKFDKNNSEHVKLKNHTIAFYNNFAEILPCKYCRDSFSKFLKEMPIEPYLNSNDNYTYWLYLMKEKVNNKLRYQENILWEETVIKAIKSDNYNSDYLTEKKQKIFHTKPTPSFESVKKRYEKFRASCSKKIQGCRRQEE